MRYYLYRHIRPDLNVPFYIGIGTQYESSERYYQRAHSKASRNKFWKHIVNKCGAFEVDILYESDVYHDVKAKEIEFIELYGRRDENKGTLVNMTDGGDGVVGSKHPNRKRPPPFSKEHREKIGAIWRGKTKPKSFGEQVSKKLTGHIVTQVTINKIKTHHQLHPWKMPFDSIQQLSNRMIGNTYAKKRTDKNQLNLGL